MPRPCSVCAHDQRVEIDEQLVAGVGYRSIAERHSVTPSSLTRHRKSHVSPALAAIAAQREHDGALSLHDRVEALYTRAERILAQAEAGGQGSLSLGAIREMRSVCELLGRLSGELDDRPTVQVLNVQQSPDWLALRGVILTALAPHPDARAAVVAALSARDTPRKEA